MFWLWAACADPAIGSKSLEDAILGHSRVATSSAKSLDGAEIPGREKGPTPLVDDDEDKKESSHGKVVKDHGEGSSDDEGSPVPVDPLRTLSRFFSSECIQECEGGPDFDEEDSFLALFETPHFLVSPLHGSSPARRRSAITPFAEDIEKLHGFALPSMVGRTIFSHSPRQELPTTGYELRWNVDDPEVTGLYRIQVTVVRELNLFPYNVKGRSIEVHQDGQRIEIARLTCYRFRPTLLRTSTDHWQTKFPVVARFLHYVTEHESLPGPFSQYNTRYGVHPISQVLLDDLFVHPDFRGGGLGLSLVDFASRKVGDALTSIFLGLPLRKTTPSLLVCDDSRDEQDEDKDDHDHRSMSTLEQYFALLGFEAIHADYMARVNRAMIEEASPRAPVLDVSQQQLG